MATESLSWSDQSVGTDEQLAVLSTGSTYTSTEAGGAGSVQVTATLLAGDNVQTAADYNPAFYDAGYPNAGELYTGPVYDGSASAANSALLLVSSAATASPAGLSHTVTARFDFTTNDGLTYDDGVDNLDFWIGGISGILGGGAIDQLQIIAYAPDGVTLIDAADILLLSAGTNVTTGIVGGVATVEAGVAAAGLSNETGAVNVVINVPVGRIEIAYFNGSTGPQAVSISDFSFDSIPLVPACFAAGTLIETTRGPVPVEAITTEDHVITAANGPMPVRWVGHRTFAAKGALAPICIRKGTLGNSRDLLVSPAHRMAVSGWQVAVLFAEEEVLVPAKALLNGDRIYRKTGGEVTYYHILLDSHELIFAEGAAAESLFLGQDSSELSAFSQAARAEVMAIFPELHSNMPESRTIARPEISSAEAGLLTL